MPDGGAVFREGWCDGWMPDPIMTVSEWADQHRRLPAKGAAEPGPWRTTRTPYAREIMDCLSDHHPAREVVLMGSTQIAKSEIGLNWAGYTIDTNPGPMLAVLPTLDLGERWSKQRLAPMIDESPRLRAKVAPARSRDSGNTTNLKEFEGGILMITGANSAAGLSSMPVKKLLLDEVDRFPQEVEDEGDPIDLAEARTSTFQRRKVFKASSPTIASLSRIDKAWKRSDQRRYYVPCPHCGEKQHLRFEQLQAPEGRPLEAQYACEHCGCLIAEHHKTWMLEHGEWRATHPERAIAGFHLNGLYTPVGLGKTWGEHLARWFEVRNDPVRLKVFTNTVLGVTYEDPNEKLDWEEIKARAEPRRLREIPVGYLILTAGVDVQKDRLEVQVWAWGPDEHGAVVDAHVIDGDPTRPEIWEQLDKYLEQPFRNAFGVDMRIASVAVDSGYLTDDVLNYTRGRERRGIFAVKGSPDRSRPVIGRPSKVDVKRNGVTLRHGARLWMVGVNQAKHRLFARLAGDRKTEKPEERMVRFSAELPDDYYLQLTAEVYDPHAGRWTKLANRRNEALDTAVYAMAAAMHPRCRVHMMRAPQWAQWRSLVEPAEHDLFAAPNEPPLAIAERALVDTPEPAPEEEAVPPTPASESPAVSEPVQTPAPPPAAAPAVWGRRRRMRSTGLE